MNSINRSQFQTHPYHLVDASPWPISLSFSMLIVTVSAVMYMQGVQYGGLLLNLGTLLTSTGMALWFRDVILESTYLGHHTVQVKKGIIIGVALFIVSELMAFISIFWAYFHSSLSPSIEIGASWPPYGITALDPFAIPLLNTILLLSSGAFITYAHHSLIKGNRNAAINGTLLTILFAIIFTALQYYEYAEASFSIADSVFGTTFFCSTGLHGLHVIVGTLFILVQFFRLLSHHHTKSHHIGMEGAIAYWHFVDVVWLGLYASVYLWAASSVA
jgi:cytochrome c oxidase subunit 3